MSRCLLSLALLFLLPGCPGNGNGFSGAQNDDKEAPALGGAIAVATCTWGTESASLEIDKSGGVYSALVLYPNGDGSLSTQRFESLLKSDTDTELTYAIDTFNLHIDNNGEVKTDLAGQLSVQLANGSTLNEANLLCTLLE